MSFPFKAMIYKTGINLCVDVPLRITAKMTPTKGYIPIKGTINGHSFVQTLVPVKDAPYRLFVNGPMLKGSRTKLGDIVRFAIEQDIAERKEPFPPAFKKALASNELITVFEQLTPGRQKEILRYLNRLKTKESLQRNIDKVIGQLQGKGGEKKGFLRNLDA
ncbi:MAG TPA: YdeI/OmpD-associated family protein [Chitinophagaceae bacterium]|jgi:hypothetical protein|nr:YdeI/OmpD-associated family protein [Chitinophagaceae bacterium]